MGSNEFSLIFEGLNEDSQSAIHRFKLALIADLELDVEHAQALLQGTSKTVLSGQSRDELERALGVLEAAGAKVAIVTVSGTEEPATDIVDVANQIGSAHELRSSPDLMEAGTNELVEENQDEQVVTFDLDDELLSPPKKPQTPKIPEYSLSMEDDSNELYHTMGIVEPEQQATAQGHNDLCLGEPTSDAFSLESLSEDESSLVPAVEDTLNLGPVPEELSNVSAIGQEAADLRFSDLALDPTPESTPKRTEPSKGEKVAPPPPVETGLQFEQESPKAEEAPPPPRYANPDLISAESSTATTSEKKIESLSVVKETQEAPPTPRPSLSEVSRAQSAALAEPAEKEEENRSGAVPQTDPSSSALASLASLTGPTKPSSPSSTPHVDSGFSKPQLVAMFGIGLITLVGANWILFGQSPPTTQVPVLSTEDTSETRDSTEKAKVVAPLPRIAGSTMVGDLALSVNGTLNKDGSILAKVFGSTGERPPLSPAQRGGVEAAPPWLSRFDTDPWLLQSLGPNEWSGNTVAYFYIEYKNQRFRLPGLVRLRITQPAGELTRSAEVEALLSPPNDPTLPANGALIEAINDELFRIYTRATISLLDPSPSAAAGVQTAPQEMSKATSVPGV